MTPFFADNKTAEKTSYTNDVTLTPDAESYLANSLLVLQCSVKHDFLRKITKIRWILPNTNIARYVSIVKLRPDL